VSKIGAFCRERPQSRKKRDIGWNLRLRVEAFPARLSGEASNLPAPGDL
jgi:hypothetical protein